MGSRAKHNGNSKGKGAKYELINFDNRNESNPLKHEVAVRKSGGLFLSSSGVKIEIPPGASTGRRERILCAPVPSTARGLLCPWLGPNLRMASEMQLIFAPHSFRQPVAIIIPFSYASAREMAYPLEEELGPIDRFRVKPEVTNKEGYDGDSNLLSEASSVKNYKDIDKEGLEESTSPAVQPKNLTSPDILDTRSVFLLTYKLGEDKWEVVDNFKIIQPLLHHSAWPTEIKRLVVQSTRWPDQSYMESSAAIDSQLGSKRLSGSMARGRRTTAAPLREFDPLEFVRSIENYCGGVYFTAEELCHCFVLVLGTKAENFVLNREGGLYRSPLLHPHLKVRIPKRSCLEDRLACVKLIDIRPAWIQAAVHFDPQMAEVEGCSDIYELDLPKVILKRPATVRIPLPQWFVEKQSKNHETLDQNSMTVGSSEPQEAIALARKRVVDGVYVYEKPLLLLYQSTASKRQIVWQVANTDDAKEDSGRRKSRFQVPRKEIMSASKCKLDNLHLRLGWSHLTVGIRGGQWFTIKKPVYFTKRTAFFETNILGRFVLIGARDSERTPANKLAHLMTRVEALATTPPGALVIFLRLQQNCWRVMANIYPEERLNDSIQEQVAAGWTPLVQVAGGLIRRATSLCNALLQAAELIQLPKETADMGKSRKTPPLRFSGADINHVLMFSGLCLEFRFTGDVRLKPVSQFEAMSQVLKSLKRADPEVTTSQVWGQDLEKRDLSLNALSSKQHHQQQRPVKLGLELPSRLTSTVCFQHHELMHETACIVEIEPLQLQEDKYIKKSAEKTQMITEMLRKGYREKDSTMDDEDEEEDEEEDATYSDDEGGRRSSLNEVDAVAPYEGDDGEADELVKDTKEQAVKNQPLSVAAVNAELLRRLNNVVEKNKMNRAANFLQKIHDVYHAGTIQVWLVPPQTLSQLAACKGTNKEGSAKNRKLHSSQSESGQTSSRSDSVTRSVSRTNDAMVEDGLQQETPPNEEGHNAIRWNPVDLHSGLDGKSPLMPDLLVPPDKPLAVYNLLIDPDLAISYLRNSGASSIAPSVTQKRTNKNKGRGNRGSPKQRKQRNVSATSRGKRAVAPSTPIAQETTMSPSSHVLEIAREEMRMFTDQNLLLLASHIKEPQKLAESLGFLSLDIDDTTKEYQTGTVEMAYDILSMWNKLHSGSLCQNESIMDSELNSEQSKGSPVQDLIDVLQSLGYFEAVEMVSGMRKACTQCQ